VIGHADDMVDGVRLPRCKTYHSRSFDWLSVSLARLRT